MPQQGTSKEIQLNMSELSAGNYMLEIRSKKNTVC